MWHVQACAAIGMECIPPVGITDTAVVAAQAAAVGRTCTTFSSGWWSRLHITSTSPYTCYYGTASMTCDLLPYNSWQSVCNCQVRLPRFDIMPCRMARPFPFASYQFFESATHVIPLDRSCPL